MGCRSAKIADCLGASPAHAGKLNGKQVKPVLPPQRCVSSRTCSNVCCDRSQWGDTALKTTSACLFILVTNATFSVVFALPRVSSRGFEQVLRSAGPAVMTALPIATVSHHGKAGRRRNQPGYRPRRTRALPVSASRHMLRRAASGQMADPCA